MNRKGIGYVHEILFIFILLVLTMTYYLGDAQELMPPLLLMIGGILIVGGMVVREPLMVTGGIGLFAVALMYSEVYL
jgi:hypothetical protein